MRLIDADALIRAFNEAQVEFDEYYKGLGRAKVITDNAPTIEPRIEYGTDGQPYRLFMSGGQVVPDMLQGWRYEERPTGEWVRKVDVIQSIAKQYNEHDELVPMWLSIGDMKGDAE